MGPPSPSPCLVDLQAQWTYIYKTQLPSLAKSRNSAQNHWPVSLDHCFARIILDNAVGVSEPWTRVVKAPAVRHMSEKQLVAAIQLGTEVVEGKVDLKKLNERSLELRGKNGPGGKRRRGEGEGGKLERGEKKVRTEEGTISKYFSNKSGSSTAETKTELEKMGDTSNPPASPSSKVMQDSSHLASPKLDQPSERKVAIFRSEEDPLKLIAASSSLTTFRKHVLSLLCGIPTGEYTTYGGLANHISQTTGKKTCARAIGSAMRNNPFAPVVPCHRVLAADRKIGGFGGSWGEDGKHASEKIALLRGEGVRFDGSGKALKNPWIGWNESSTVEQE